MIKTNEEEELKKENEEEKNKIDQLKKEEHFYDVDPEEEALKLQEKKNVVEPSVVLQFLKQWKATTEFWRITVPIFIIQPISLLEKISIYCTPSSIIKKTAKLKTPEKRILSITSWLLSTWRSLPRFGIECVKPYNPVLGEQFNCHWDHQDGSTTSYISEQVSHHPPISAFYQYNKQRGICYYGHLFPKLKLGLNLNNISTEIEGFFCVEILNDLQERYVFKYPNVHIGGLLLGQRHIDIQGKMKIICEKTQLSSEIKFDTIFNKNNINGKIKKIKKKENQETNNNKGGWLSILPSFPFTNFNNEDSKKSETLFSFEGDFTKKVSIKSEEDKKSFCLYNIKNLVKDKKKTKKPLHKQDPHIDSRRVWHQSHKYLRVKDFENANIEKSNVENYQRNLRKIRKQNNETFIPKLFKKDQKTGKWLIINDPLKDDRKID